jgi:hypothetical protein
MGMLRRLKRQLGHLSIQFLVSQTCIPSFCPNCSAPRAYPNHSDLACRSWDDKLAIMSLRGKFTAGSHSRSQPGRAETDPIKDLLHVMGAINFDVGKEAVGIMAADSVSFWQSVNTIKNNGDAQRSCDPDKQGFNLRFAQQFVNWLRYQVPPPFWQTYKQNISGLHDHRWAGLLGTCGCSLEPPPDLGYLRLKLSKLEKA